MADNETLRREAVATYLTLLSENELRQLLAEVEQRRPQDEDKTSYTWGDMDTDIPTTYTNTDSSQIGLHDGH